jgi:hypothetical protein
VKILKGEFATGAHIRIDVEDDQLVFTSQEQPAEIPQEQQSLVNSE